MLEVRHAGPEGVVVQEQERGRWQGAALIEECEHLDGIAREADARDAGFQGPEEQVLNGEAGRDAGQPIGDRLRIANSITSRFPVRIV